MSDMGAIMDALSSAAVTAVTTLTSANAERGIRLAKDLADSEYPHLFLYDPDETSELFAHLQRRVSTEVTMTLATSGETQEALALKLDLIRDQIRTDPTLGGIVRWAFVQERGIREDPRESVKAGDLVVLAVQEA